MMNIDNNEYVEYRDALEGGSITTVWSVSPPDEFVDKEFTFLLRKEFFLLFLQLLMQEGKIKIGKHGKLLEGTIEDQIAVYRLVFPKTEDEWKARGEDLWFYEEDCPGGIVWVSESGYLDWT